VSLRCGPGIGIAQGEAAGVRVPILEGAKPSILKVEVF